MSLYAGIPPETLQAHLIEAQAAWHALHTGQQVASLTSADGERLVFTPTNREVLLAYIRGLQVALAIAQGQPPRGVAAVATWTR